MKFRFLRTDYISRALLITDPTSSTAGLSLDIADAGSQSDPFDLPGLMHLLEHTLLFGKTDKRFRHFLETRQGLLNGCTGSRRMNLHFTCESTGLEEGISLFFDHVLAPTLDVDAIKREVNVIDEEHRKNLSNEDRRLNAVIQHLTVPSLPMHKFSTDSLDHMERWVTTALGAAAATKTARAAHSPPPPPSPPPPSSSPAVPSSSYVDSEPLYAWLRVHQKALVDALVPAPSGAALAALTQLPWGNGDPATSPPSTGPQSRADFGTLTDLPADFPAVPSGGSSPPWGGPSPRPLGPGSPPSPPDSGARTPTTMALFKSPRPPATPGKGGGSYPGGSGSGLITAKKPPPHPSTSPLAHLLRDLGRAVPLPEPPAWPFATITPGAEPPTSAAIPPAVYCVEVDTLRVFQTLTLLFVLPPILPWLYLFKPTQLISHLLTDERPGTLTASLKQAGWIDGLTASCDPTEATFTPYRVTFTLTRVGASHLADIAAALFEYLALLVRVGEPALWRQVEVRQVVANGTRFQERPSVQSMLIDIASGLHHYPPHLLLSAPAVPFVAFPALTRHLITSCLLPPARMLMIFQRPANFMVSPPPSLHRDPWYGVVYTTRVIPPVILRDWEIIAQGGIVEPEPRPPSALHIPQLPVYEALPPRQAAPSPVSWAKSMAPAPAAPRTHTPRPTKQHTVTPRTPLPPHGAIVPSVPGHVVDIGSPLPLDMEPGDEACEPDPESDASPLASLRSRVQLKKAMVLDPPAIAPVGRGPAAGGVPPAPKPPAPVVAAGVVSHTHHPGRGSVTTSTSPLRTDDDTDEGDGVEASPPEPSSTSSPPQSPRYHQQPPPPALPVALPPPLPAPPPPLVYCPRYPVAILQTPQARVFHKQDVRYRQPRICAGLHWHAACRSPREAALTSMGVMWLCERLHRPLRPAEYGAGMTWDLGATPGGLCLTCSGFHQAMPALLVRLLEGMLQPFGRHELPPPVEPLRSNLANHLRNQQRQPPSRLVRQAAALLLSPHHWSPAAQLAALQEVWPTRPMTAPEASRGADLTARKCLLTLPPDCPLGISGADLTAHMRRILGQCRVELLLVGNCSQPQSSALGTRLLDMLQAFRNATNTPAGGDSPEPVSPPSDSAPPRLRLFEGAQLVRSGLVDVTCPNERETNAAAQVVLVGGPSSDPREGALCLLLESILAPCLTAQLRDAEQLGPRGVRVFSASCADLWSTPRSGHQW
ncbi:hypothetical protein PAPYR_4039 [Paratrimastix pyriformis]|uniref:Uncharacterized protein n=1 Tax=Paratrimastix pyriformis TaxID=342808 RepID=A0ABQ8URI1_9EUKA|nr:hypothetical protein PAPYR_4039 [Paratrimastix pyriformis]